MDERDSKGRPLITVVRIIEYHGTQEWIEGTVRASRVPMQGEFTTSFEGKPLPEGCFIRSGMVNWVDPDAAGGQAGGQSEQTVIPIPPGSSGGITH